VPFGASISVNFSADFGSFSLSLLYPFLRGLQASVADHFLGDERLKTLF
jgi:hypothetical protein